MPGHHSPDRSFADHFSRQAGVYARARPTYPAALFDALAEAAPARGWALDVGCGSGQATAPLATRFAQVIGTEPSLSQLAGAAPSQRGRLVVATAEQPLVSEPIFDLVVAAQAAHWFDMQAFADTVASSARPGALVAVWCYSLFELPTPVLEHTFKRFYREELEPWWPPGREHVDTGYRSLAFPFEEEPAPSFAIERAWTLDELLAYLGTWSALQRRLRAGAADPLPELRECLEALWGDRRRTVRWPISMRWGRSARHPTARVLP